MVYLGCFPSFLFSKTLDVKVGFTGLQEPISKLMIGGVGAQVSHEPPPPLPGDYVVGEQVYFTGTGETLASVYSVQCYRPKKL